MGTGGYTPKSISQTCTIINVTPYIDRGSNLYYAPSFDYLDEETQLPVNINEEFANLLISLCQDTYARQYGNVEISQWSPEDRTLTVKGNIDDFRARGLRSLGYDVKVNAGLNYVIIKRYIVKTQQTEEYIEYYGFFIDKAEQAGGNSVKLYLTPDHFSNAFYFLNTTILNVSNYKTYDPFNEIMKNCYVERQHYDRFKKLMSIELSYANANNIDYFKEGALISFTDDNFTEYYILERLLQLTNNVIVLYVSSGESMIDNTQITTSMQITAKTDLEVSASAQITGQVTSVIKNVNICYSNNPLFLNHPVEGNYRYQYRDSKEPISNDTWYSNKRVYSNFTKNELDEIENLEWEQLSTATKDKIARCCIQWLVVETKSFDITCNYKTMLSPEKIVYIDGGNKEADLTSPNIKMAFPLFSIPEKFQKFNISLSRANFYDINANQISMTKADYVMRVLAEGELANYIYDAYIVRDLLIPADSITFSYEGTGVIVRVHSSSQLPYPIPLTTLAQKQGQVVRKGNQAGGLLTSIDYLEHKDDTINCIRLTNPVLSQSSLELTSYDVEYDSSHICLGLMASGYEKSDYRIKLEDSLLTKTEVKNNFRDPVLEQEPYRFYSVSTLSDYEMVFNRNRYFKAMDNVIDIEFYLSMNGGLKQGIIPCYVMEGVKTKYFNEGLNFVTSTSLPLSSDAYSSFYYQNKSQMKAQYAVNNISATEGFINTTVGALTGLSIAHIQAGVGTVQGALSGVSSAIGGTGEAGIITGAIGGGVQGAGGLQIAGTKSAGSYASWLTSSIAQQEKTKTQQNALLADMGRKPDSLRQAGSDIFYSLKNKENHLYLNHYNIDELSYNSIAKFYERYGYIVNLYDTIKPNNRVGWNYVKLIAFEFDRNSYLNEEQKASVRSIFSAGVTLLHDKNFLTTRHNYERILDE